MICTHYEADHLPGLTNLLLRPGRYDNTVIYDRGWPEGGQDDMYKRYLRAMNGLGDNGPKASLAHVQRIRMTSAVQADDSPPELLGVTLTDPAMPPGGGPIDEPPEWLLTAAAPDEILWDGEPAIPPGAPTMTCIAVNHYIKTAGGGNTGPIGGLATDTNSKSLAFEVRFNNFRYYLGGDIETDQEDHIQVLLNPGDDAAGRVTAVKASHHGASTATSRQFVNQMRPSGIFISCGTKNTYPHPATETVNVLDGYPAMAFPHPAPPPEAPYRPIRNYLTGYGTIAPAVVSYGGLLSITAGDPIPPKTPGTIYVTVTEDQSNSRPEGRIWLAVREVVRRIASNANLAGFVTAAVALQGGELAAEFALTESFSDTASAVVALLGGSPAMRQATEAAAATAYNDGPKGIATTITAGAIGQGVPAAIAAAAGAAAGTRARIGANYAIQTAVRAALETAGIATATAAHEALQAVYAVGAVSPPEGQFDVEVYIKHNDDYQTFTHLG